HAGENRIMKQLMAVWPCYEQRTEIPLPQCFDGEFQGFVNQCHSLFLVCPLTHATDEAKVALAISLLTGKAFRPGFPLLGRPKLVMTYCSVFLQPISSIFNDSN
uniref:DUF4939 domain-containing protein n=1 Tax=Pelusios castaneus TaxID=367368 RepID=A0A8C8RB36_9SAUR